MNKKLIVSASLLLFFASVNLYGSYYAGIFVPYFSLSGKSYKGDTIQTNGGVVVSVPSLGNSLGFGLFFGARQGNFAIELGYSHLSHASSLFDPRYNMTANRDSTTGQYVRVNAKFFISLIKKLDLFGTLGLNYVHLTVDDAHFTLETELSGDQFKLQSDAKLSGFGFNAGGGLTYFLSKNLSSNLEIGVNLNSVASFKGTYHGSSLGSVDSSFRLEGMGLFILKAAIGVSYHF